MLEREDALQMGVRLRAEEQAASEYRIANAIPHGPPGSDYGGARQFRAHVAQELYDARYEGPVHEELAPPDQVLDKFCWRIFAASFEEVVKAWDIGLG